MNNNITWFKGRFTKILEGYKIDYSYFENGDFGNLERVEIEGNEKMGNIDFWSSGWLSIYLVDSAKKDELINILLEPEQQDEKAKAFQELWNLLS